MHSIDEDIPSSSNENFIFNAVEVGTTPYTLIILEKDNVLKWTSQ